MSTRPEPITRDDIEAKFRELTGEVTDEVESTRSQVITVGRPWGSPWWPWCSSSVAATADAGRPSSRSGGSEPWTPSCATSRSAPSAAVCGGTTRSGWWWVWPSGWSTGPATRTTSSTRQAQAGRAPVHRDPQVTFHQAPRPLTGRLSAERGSGETLPVDDRRLTEPTPGLLRDGERVLLVDAKERRYLLTLRAGASFHTHAGIVAHDDVIGRRRGSTVLGSTGRRFVVVRPTLAGRRAEDARAAPRSSTRRTSGPSSSRPTSGRGCGSSRPASGRARCRWPCCGPGPRWWATSCGPISPPRPGQRGGLARDGCPVPGRGRDVYEGIDEVRPRPHRPRPARAVARPAARRQGAASRWHRLRLPAVDHAGGPAARRPRARAPSGWPRPEVLRRTWHVEERSVRPDHRMVGHTGFLTTARLLVPSEEEPAGADGDSEERGCGLALLDEDALPGAFLGRLGHGVLEVGGDDGHAGGAARLVLDVVALLDVGEAVVERA